MQRVCFTLQVSAADLPSYRARHMAVWPEMLREIAASGRQNYTLFDAGDGLIIGYFETDDLAASSAYLAQSEIAAKWEAEMRPYFAHVCSRADQELQPLPELFNLADQIGDRRSDSDRDAQ